MKKFFLAALMIAATMSVNAKGSVKANDLQEYDNLFETVDCNNDKVLDFYNKNASVEAKASFYMFALDNYYASHKQQIKKDCPAVLAGYKMALKNAMAAKNETSMKKWCHAMEDNFPQIISEAAELVQD